MSTHTAVEAFLARISNWWARNKLASIDQKELGRIAGEFGMTTADLLSLVERGPDAAHLLYERMRVLGVSQEDVGRAAHVIMRDLERTCACCNDKGVCEKDLVQHPDDPVWKTYCPNAVTLESLVKLKEHGTAS